MRIPCSACYGGYRKPCRECRSLGYTEIFEKCSMKQPECPIEYEPMVNGWMCNKCGRSGPL